jgi:ribosome-binding protein aMBF1 (putative translation factor)
MTPKQTPRREVDMLIKGIAAHIREAQKRGVTYDQLAAKIAEKYPIKQSILKSAMQQFNKHDPAARRKKRRRAERGASTSLPPASTS